MSANGDSIGPGSEVVLHFTLTLEDGTVAESSREGEPLAVTIGDGTLIGGLERALYGFKAGDRQTLFLEPPDAFGLRQEENIHRLPRSEFPPEMELTPGTIVGFTTPSGEELPGMVRELDTETVSVDFNHPLAGHRLAFEVEILSVNNPGAK